MPGEPPHNTSTGPRQTRGSGFSRELLQTARRAMPAPSLAPGRTHRLRAVARALPGEVAVRPALRDAVEHTEPRVNIAPAHSASHPVGPLPPSVGQAPKKSPAFAGPLDVAWMSLFTAAAPAAMPRC